MPAPSSGRPAGRFAILGESDDRATHSKRRGAEALLPVIPSTPTSLSQVPEPLSIVLERGPVSDESLDAIAATYGTVDRRYADREFCRIVFNENPSGYSYHAFVKDGDRIVGHYAVIPIRTRARGALVTSGKGEALFLDEANRRSVIAAPGGGDVPAAMALMRLVHEGALEDGLAVIHSITSPEIGVIERLLGFRVLTVLLDQFHFLSTLPRRSLKNMSVRVFGAQVASVLQRVLLGAVRLALRLTGTAAVEVNAAAHVGRHLEALAATDGGGAGWTVSRDLENLRWFQRLGRIEIFSVAGRPDHFAVITTGAAREILLWSVPRDAIRSSLALACALTRGSVRDRAQTLSASRKLATEDGASLRLTLGLLGFLPRRVPFMLYAKSGDPFYVQSSNVDFSRLFHL